MGESKDIEYVCLIAVTDKGQAILLASIPDLYENDVFDGMFLEDNINKDKKNIPKDFGIYKCKIMVYHYNYDTDCGTEYDVNIWIKDLVKIELP